MEWKIKREILPLTVMVLFVALSFYFYPTLPETMPSHFNVEGKPDRFAPKLNLMLMIFTIIVGMYVILTFIPLIDPFWKKIQKKYSLFLIFRDIVLVFFLFLYILSISATQKGTLSTGVLGIGFGLLFIWIGNYLPQLPRNWFFGIRTPWTLSSETVWKSTHIVGGWLFVAGGILTVILSLLKIHLGIVLLLTLGPVVLFAGVIYPLYLYKKLQKEGKT